MTIKTSSKSKVQNSNGRLEVIKTSSKLKVQSSNVRLEELIKTSSKFKAQNSNDQLEESNAEVSSKSKVQNSNGRLEVIKTSSKLKVQSSNVRLEELIKTSSKFKVQNSNGRLEESNAEVSSKSKVQSPNDRLEEWKTSSRLKALSANVYLENLRPVDSWFVKENTRPYDLQARTFTFAKRVIALVGKLQKSIANIEIGKQVVRSAGSVGANYIEAGESLSDKDFMLRIKICRKEAKESCYWLKLLDCNSELNAEREELAREALELTKIFGSIVYKQNSI